MFIGGPIGPPGPIIWPFILMCGPPIGPFGPIGPFCPIGPFIPILPSGPIPIPIGPP